MAETNSENHGIKEQKQIEFLLQFSASTTDYCVCIVDIVGSTRIMMSLPHAKVSRYYEIFLNKMAEIVRKFDGIVVKNIGDSLLFYFPNTSTKQILEFENVLNCCFVMIETNPEINQMMSSEDLPPIKYRISGEYGPVIVAKISTSSTNDIFGNTVNICSKINRLAEPNSMVIGEGLHKQVQSFSEYAFTKIDDVSGNQEFAVYSVLKKSV